MQKLGAGAGFIGSYPRKGSFPKVAARACLRYLGPRLPANSHLRPRAPLGQVLALSPWSAHADGTMVWLPQPDRVLAWGLSLGSLRRVTQGQVRGAHDMCVLAPACTHACSYGAVHPAPPNSREWVAQCVLGCPFPAHRPRRAQGAPLRRTSPSCATQRSRTPAAPPEPTPAAPALSAPCGERALPCRTRRCRCGWWRT